MDEVYEVTKTTFAYIGFVQTAVLLSIIVWTSSRDRIRNNGRARKANQSRVGGRR